MATLDDYRMIPLQVSTPLKDINPHFEVSEQEYDYKSHWERNEDNDPSKFSNRCKEVKSLNLVKLLKYDLIKKHVASYNYNAACEVMETIAGARKTSLGSLLEIAKNRSQLDILNAKTAAEALQVDVFPIKDAKYLKVYEYMLVVWLKMKRGELADFIRAITPLVVNLYELILEKECGIIIEELTALEKNNRKVCSKEKMRKVNPKIIQVLDQEFKSFKYDSDIYSRHIAVIIKGLSKDGMLGKKLDEMTGVEQNVRNIAAHTIVKISDEDIKKRSGKSAGQIFELFKYFELKAGFKNNSKIWNVYDDMNRLINAEIDKVLL